MWKNLTFAQQVSLQNSPTYTTSLNVHPHWLLMCTQSAYLIVVFYMQTFYLWKWKSPWRMSNLALSIHGTPLHFSKSCSRKTLSLPLPHRREVEWREAEQSSSGKESSTLWGGVCRGQLTRSSLGNAEGYGHFDVALSRFPLKWSQWRR